MRAAAQRATFAGLPDARSRIYCARMTGLQRAALNVAIYKAVRNRACPPWPIRACPPILVPDSYASGTNPAYAAAASAEAQLVKFTVATSSQAVVIGQFP